MSGVCCSTVFVSVIDSILLCIYNSYIYIYILYMGAGLESVCECCSCRIQEV